MFISTSWLHPFGIAALSLWLFYFVSPSFRYGLVWISTTLVFVIASLGNCATYLMHRRSDHGTSWTFDVSYINVAACSIYGYSLIVPLAYYFLLRYLGSNASLIRFWCLWGYSLFIFILSSVSISAYLVFLSRNKLVTWNSIPNFVLS